MDKHTPIPPLRNDLDLQLIEHEGNKYVLMQDTYGYAAESIAVSLDFYNLTLHFNSDSTFEEIEKILLKQGVTGDLNPIFDLITKLDNDGFLLSRNFFELRNKIESEYINSPVRPSVCAGSVFPDDPRELKSYLDAFFNSSDKLQIQGDAKSVIVPHIDFRVGNEVHKTYAAGYHSIRNTEADLYVIFGTSHYANSDFFMLTNKDFETPLGSVQTDIELINELSKYLGDDLTVDDFAHKPEHSIELQAVLLKHYFADRDFKILPVLTGSLHEYILNGEMPEHTQRYANFLDALKKSIEYLGRKAVYISSVDFAHIGRKFGDDYDAEPTLGMLKSEDAKLIDALLTENKNDFFAKIQNDKDKYKICGTAPIYAMMTINNPKDAKFFNYAQWNEIETKSAVSFASIAYYK